jgi:uncharacterized surface protein with fasciclin (FAS1) repeats
MNLSSLRTAISATAILTLAACGSGGGAGNETGAQMSNDMSVEEVATAETNSSSATVMVGGAEMFPNKTIVENASKSADHTTLVAAVKAAGLVETLSGPGPFTVFAPTNAAFQKLPAGTVDTLVKPESKKALTGILTYHVVAGRMTAQDLAKAIEQGGGTAKLTTVAGGSLTATQTGGTITLKDAKGGTSKVTQGDVMQSNGVVHVVDTVLMPS